MNKEATAAMGYRGRVGVNREAKVTPSRVRAVSEELTQGWQVVLVEREHDAHQKTWKIVGIQCPMGTVQSCEGL